jgi:hypothetical protein
MWFSKLLRTLLLCCSAGGGAAFIYALVEKEPRMVLETLQKFGPETFLGLIALLMLDRSIKNGISILRESTQAQQRLADAVQEIAHKDDREREEQRRLMNYIGAQQERILDVFQQHMDKEKETKSKGASA